MDVVSAHSRQGVHVVAKVEIAKAISRAGGSVNRSGLKLALSELSEGITEVPPRILRVSSGRHTMRSDETKDWHCAVA